MSQINLMIDQWFIIINGFIQGIGLGLSFVPLTIITFATLDPNYRLEATSLFTLVRNIGSSIGISIVATFITRVNILNTA